MKKISLVVAFLVAASALAGTWDSKFLFVGRFATSGANGTATVPAPRSGGVSTYVKVSCHDSTSMPVDTYLGIGQADGGLGASDAGMTGPCKQVDAGFACDLVRFSLGQQYFARVTAPDTNVWGYAPDGGICEVFVGTN